MIGGVQLGEQQLVQLLPDPGLVPGAQPAPGGHPATEAELLRQVLPGSTQRAARARGSRFIDEMILVASANAASTSASAPGSTSSTACSVTTGRFDGAGPRNELEIVRRDDGAVLADEADRDWGSVAASARDPRWRVGEVAVAPLHQRNED